MNKKSLKSRKLGLKLFLATLPFIVLYFLFCYLPLKGWLYAFYDYKPGRSLAKCEFVGLENFLYMFSTSYMRRNIVRVLTNTFAMSTIGIVTSFIPMFFAILLNEIPGARLRKLIQTVTTIPHFVGWVIVYAMAFAMFAVDSGFLNNLLRDFGVIDKGLNILGSSKHVWLTMWLYSTWKGTGWSAIIYIAGISSIDQELYEAAVVDGANRFQKMRYITVPGLMQTFLVLLIMSVGHFLSNGMEQYYVFSNAFNVERIEVLDLYVYNMGVVNNDYATSIAVGIMKSLVGLLLFAITNNISGKIREEKIF